MGGRNHGRSRGVSMELGGLGSFGDPIAPLIGSGGGLEPPGGLADTSFTSVGWSFQQPPNFAAYPPLAPAGGGPSGGGPQATLMREAKPMKLSLGRSPRGHANSIDTSMNSDSARMRAYSWGVPDAPTEMGASCLAECYAVCTPTHASLPRWYLALAPYSPRCTLLLSRSLTTHTRTRVHTSTTMHLSSSSPQIRANSPVSSSSMGSAAGGCELSQSPAHWTSDW